MCLMFFYATETYIMHFLEAARFLNAPVLAGRKVNFTLCPSFCIFAGHKVNVLYAPVLVGCKVNVLYDPGLAERPPHSSCFLIF